MGRGTSRSGNRISWKSELVPLITCSLPVKQLALLCPSRNWDVCFQERLNQRASGFGDSMLIIGVHWVVRHSFSTPSLCLLPRTLLVPQVLPKKEIQGFFSGEAELNENIDWDIQCLSVNLLSIFPVILWSSPYMHNIQFSVLVPLINMERPKISRYLRITGD